MSLAKFLADNVRNSHPYGVEINSLLENPILEFDHISGNLDLEISDEYVWVETELRLKELAASLSKERVFAVDTEQHSLRSFLGFTALIQVKFQIMNVTACFFLCFPFMSILFREIGMM